MDTEAHSIAGRYSFDITQMKELSPDSKDLISKLLVVDPKQRLTAYEALHHDIFITKRQEIYKN